MANVRIVSTSTVHATATTTGEVATQKLHPTPFDLRLFRLGTIQKGLLFHKPNNHDYIQHLKASLFRTLSLFPPLAGRLATAQHDDGTAFFFINCDNSGALFVHAVADEITVSDILQPIFVPRIVWSFFPLNGIKNYEGVTEPLLGVQVTELADGVFIGCTMNHSVADGTGFWNFFNFWSGFCRGDRLDGILKSPVFGRSSFIDNSGYPIRVPLSITQNLFDGFVPPPLKERIFHFSKEKIAALKARANSEIGLVNKISSLQALLAHLWRSVIRGEGNLTGEDRHLRFPKGLRPRWLPPLPQEYFGNAVHTTAVTLKAGEVLEQSLGNIALQLNREIALHTPEKLRGVMEKWVENPTMRAMGDFISNSILISSSPRFIVYGNDFGWGRPIAVRSGPANKFDGKMTLFPGVEEGSIDIEVCASIQILQAMGNDPEFMASVGDCLKICL